MQSENEEEDTYKAINEDKENQPDNPKKAKKKSRLKNPNNTLLVKISVSIPIYFCNIFVTFLGRNLIFSPGNLAQKDA